MALSTTLRKVTPVLAVDRIEPVVSFWRKLDVLPTVEVPDSTADDGRLGFVILAADGIEIMYQSIASIRQDLRNAALVKEAFPDTTQQGILYVEVGQLTEVETRLHGERVILPRRTTFYGSTEIGYADPAGNVIIFAEHAPAANAGSPD